MQKKHLIKLNSYQFPDVQLPRPLAPSTARNAMQKFQAKQVFKKTAQEPNWLWLMSVGRWLIMGDVFSSIFSSLFGPRK